MTYIRTSTYGVNAKGPSIESSVDMYKASTLCIINFGLNPLEVSIIKLKLGLRRTMISSIVRFDIIQLLGRRHSLEACKPKNLTKSSPRVGDASH